MTENHQEPPARRPLKVTPSNKTLSLGKRSVEQGMVRQTFTHGRTKQVVVEKVKRRAVGPGEGKAAEAPSATPPAPAPQRRGASGGRGGQASSSGRPSGVVLRQLTEEERTARAQALTQSKITEAEERRQAEDAARQRAEKEAAERAEREAAEARKREEEERRRQEEEAKRRAETEAKKRFGDEEARARPATPPAQKLAASQKTGAAQKTGAPQRTGAPKPVTAKPATAKPGGVTALPTTA